MKKMILYFGIILFVVILVLILMVIVIFLQKNNYVKTNSIDSTFTEAKVLNENSYLGFLYLQSSDFSDRTLSKLNDDMPGNAVTSDEHVTGWVFFLSKRHRRKTPYTNGDYRRRLSCFGNQSRRQHRLRNKNPGAIWIPKYKIRKQSCLQGNI